MTAIGFVADAVDAAGGLAVTPVLSVPDRSFVLISDGTVFGGIDGVVGTEAGGVVSLVPSSLAAVDSVLIIEDCPKAIDNKAMKTIRKKSNVLSIEIEMCFNLQHITKRKRMFVIDIR